MLRLAVWIPRAAGTNTETVARTPFHDGNKRIAFVTIAVFLELNGVEFEASEAEVVTVMPAIAAGELDEDGLAAWLRARSKDEAGGACG